MGTLLLFPTGHLGRTTVGPAAPGVSEQTDVGKPHAHGNVHIGALATDFIAAAATVSSNLEVRIDGDALIVERDGRLSGIWMCIADHYGWIPAGYLLPSIRCRTTSEAVRATLAGFASHATKLGVPKIESPSASNVGGFESISPIARPLADRADGMF